MNDKLALLQRQAHQGQPHCSPSLPSQAPIAQAPSCGSAQQQQQPPLPENTGEESSG